MFNLTPPDIRRNLRRASIVLVTITLLYSPFPLGGAISWAAPVQEFLVCLAWILWAASRYGRSHPIYISKKIVLLPLLFQVLVLAYVLLQLNPELSVDIANSPAATVHNVLGGHPVFGLSANTWKTSVELAKLSSYVLAGWLVFNLSHRSKTAKFFLKAVMVIGALYAVYAFALKSIGYAQVGLFYKLSVPPGLMAGPFMLHNSFATYMAMITATAAAVVVSRAGQRQLSNSISVATHDILNFCSARGLPVFLVMVLCLGALVTSASRAGVIAFGLGIIALILSAAALSRQRETQRSTIFVSGAVVLLLCLPIFLNGDVLAERLATFVDGGAIVRITMWRAAYRMIASAPLTGFGLGTYQDIYPYFTDTVLPTVVDRAHCDYLELAAGIGIPAAMLWWLSLAFVPIYVFVRARKNNVTSLWPILAISVSTIVAAHSIVDFSLQMPAVSMLFVTLLGVSAAQSTRETKREYILRRLRSRSAKMQDPYVVRYTSRQSKRTNYPLGKTDN